MKRCFSDLQQDLKGCSHWVVLHEAERKSYQLENRFGDPRWFNRNRLLRNRTYGRTHGRDDGAAVGGNIRRRYRFSSR